MVYVDLPPEVEADQGPVAQGRPGRPPLSLKRAWRREGLMKHLVEPTVVAETANPLEQQAADIYEAFKPRDGRQDWLTSTIATIMLRISRSERVERKLRDYASYRAIDFWEDDQKLAVETIATRIGKESARVVAKLRETPAGIDWLIARWRILARVEPSAWTEDQRELASRLIGGTPRSTRPGPGSPPSRSPRWRPSASGSGRPTRSSGVSSRPTSTTTASRAWPSSGATSGRCTGS